MVGLARAYPDNEFISLPYGQSVLELRTLLEKPTPEVDVMISPAKRMMQHIRDDKGHADEILVDLGTLVWGKVWYDIEPDLSYLHSI